MSYHPQGHPPAVHNWIQGLQLCSLSFPELLLFIPTSLCLEVSEDRTGRNCFPVTSISQCPVNHSDSVYLWRVSTFKTSHQILSEVNNHPLKPNPDVPFPASQASLSYLRPTPAVAEIVSRKQKQYPAHSRCTASANEHCLPATAVPVFSYSLVYTRRRIRLRPGTHQPLRNHL